MQNDIGNVIDILEYLESRNDKPAALMLVDAEKAFDNISWHFMKRLM